jgi:hypothetical protein
MTATVQIQADVAPLEQAYGKLRKAYEGMAEQLDRLKSGHSGLEQAGARAAKAASELGTAGQQAAARYTAEIARLRNELAAGTLSKQQYRQAVEAAKLSLEGETRAIKDQQAEAKKLQDFAKGVAESQKTAADRQREHLGQLKQAWQAGYLSTQQYNQAVQQAATGTKGLSTLAQSAIGDLRGVAAGMVGGVTSAAALVGATVAQIRAAIEEARQLREEQSRKQLTAAESQAEVVKMLGMGTKPEESGRFIAEVEKIREQSAFTDPAAAQQAAADVLSATGGNQQLTKDVLKVALPLQRNRPSDVPAVAGAIADTARYMEATTEQDVKAAAALVVSAVGQARITAYADFKEAAQGLAAASAASTTADKREVVRQSAAIWSGLSQQLADPTGAQTKTAFAGLVGTLEKLMPEKDKVVSVEDTKRAELEAQREHLRINLDKLRRESDEPDRFAARRAAIEAENADIDKQLETGRRLDRHHTLLTPTQRAELAAKRERLAEETTRLQPRDPALIQADIAKAEAEIEKIDSRLTGETRKGTGLTDTWQRIEAMWKDEGLQQEFRESVEKSGFRAPVKLSMRSLADPESQLSKLMRRSMAGVSSDTAALDVKLAELETATPQLREAFAKARGETATSVLDVLRTAAGARAQADELTGAALQRTRAGLGDRMGEWLFRMQRPTFHKTDEEAIRRDEEQLQTRAADILYPTSRPEIRLQRMLQASPEELQTRRGRLPDKQRQDVDYLFEQLRVIRDLGQQAAPAAGPPPRGGDGAAEQLAVARQMAGTLQRLETLAGNRPTVGTSAAAGQLLTAQRQSR